MLLVRRVDNLATFMCSGFLKVCKMCVGLYVSLKNPVMQIVMVDYEHSTKKYFLSLSSHRHIQPEDTRSLSYHT
jgi:hypothetical protein